LASIIGVVTVQDIINCFQSGMPLEASRAEAQMLLQAGKWMIGLMLGAAAMLLAFLLALKALCRAA
jgi:hypothetical protein